MTKKIILFMSIFLVACQSSKTIVENTSNRKNTIVYIFPSSVDSLLINQIQTGKKKIYFCLYSHNNFYEVRVSEFAKSGEYYAKNTNRAVYINGKLYPLIFNLDMVFGTPEDINVISKRFANEEDQLILRQHTINEGYYIKFKSDGTILSSGNELLKAD